MKTIGLVGGMSWESTVTYYQVINETVKERLGGLHSAKCILYSVDLEEIIKHICRNDWVKAAEILTGAAKALERAGADFFLICSNTAHKVADRVQAEVGIPLLHIAEVTAKEVQKKQMKRIGLLGSHCTMGRNFYKKIFRKYGIEMIVPEKNDMNIVHEVIYRELCVGKILDSSREKYLAIMRKLMEKGAEAIVLGCTEIGLLVREGDTDIPIFDTTQLHARRAAFMAMDLSE